MRATPPDHCAAHRTGTQNEPVEREGHETSDLSLGNSGSGFAAFTFSTFTFYKQTQSGQRGFQLVHSFQIATVSLSHNTSLAPPAQAVLPLRCKLIRTGAKRVFNGGAFQERQDFRCVEAEEKKWENSIDESRERKRPKLRTDEPGYMDPELWKDLESHIPLDMLFAKLPLREFFQLRLVCKHWNSLAGDCKFLEASNPKPIQKPHFHLCRRGPDYQLHGLLSYTCWSKQWSYVSLGQHDELDSMVANQGLIYASKADDNSDLRVFNIHSRVWYTLPPLPPEVQCHYDGDYLPVVAIKVDTSTHPYEFQVIRAGANGPNAQSPTHTYDSRTNTWCVSELTSITDTPFKATCAQVSDAVYVWSDLDYVYCYKIKEDCWYTLDVPEEDYTFQNWLSGVGAWKERVYHMSQVHFGKHPNSWFEIIMYVWEDQKLEWEEFDRMPTHLRDWLTDSPDCEPVILEILTSYCDEWVLVWSYCCEEGNANGFVLYNVETRVWEIAGVPDGLVQPFLDDEESETFHPGSHCYHRKKARNWAMYQDRGESSDTDDQERHADRNLQPATLDEWNKILDQL